MKGQSTQSRVEFWRNIVNDFNPVGPVSPDDVKEVFVDRKEGEPTRSIVSRLGTSLRISIGQRNLYRGLLTGHVGSGKTSELMRLAQEVAADFFVVWFDAEASLSKENVNHFDVLLAMGVAIHAAAGAVGLKPDKKLADEFVNSFASFLRKFEDKRKFTLKLDQLLQQVFTIAVTVGAGALGGPALAVMAGAAAASAGEAFKATALELNVSDQLIHTLELPANRQEVIGRLNRIIDDVNQRAAKPVLVITDGLDKLTALKARLLFADSSLLAEPGSALIYTAPIEFYHRLSSGVTASAFTEYSFLPNPPVCKRPAGGWKEDRESNPEGREILRKIVARRIERRKRTIESVIDADALDLIVGASGGIVRDVIRFMRDAAISAQIGKNAKIDKPLAQSVIDMQRQEMYARLSIQLRDALTAVVEQGSLKGGASESVEDDLLHAAYLLSYQADHGKSWFDAHPNALFVLCN
jgi:hypothetical protein